MTDEIDTIEEVKANTLKVAAKIGLIGSFLAGGTTLIAQYDDLLGALAKDKIQAAYGRGQKDQLKATLNQTAMLSACNTAIVCLEHKDISGEEIADCQLIRSAHETSAINILASIEGVNETE